MKRFKSGLQNTTKKIQSNIKTTIITFSELMAPIILAALISIILYMLAKHKRGEITLPETSTKTEKEIKHDQNKQQLLELSKEVDRLRYELKNFSPIEKTITVIKESKKDERNRVNNLSYDSSVIYFTNWLDSIKRFNKVSDTRGY